MIGIICLAEKSYWNGVSTLINATLKHNFEGIILIGYRGDKPKWMNSLLKDNDCYYINSKLSIKAFKLETKRHLGFEKVFFIDRMIKEFNLDNFFFFDTDCIPITDFDFFKKWSNNHIAVCEDECFSKLHKNHPWKINWVLHLKKNGFQNLSFNHPYINSGFLSIPKNLFILVDIWKKLTEYLESNGLNTINFNKNPTLSIQGDQEILNMALMTLDSEQLSIIGKEGMGFKDPIFLMVHCTNNKKPWNNFFVLNFLMNGLKISNREKIYIQYFNKPFKSLSNFRLMMLKLDIKITSLLSRIF